MSLLNLMKNHYKIVSYHMAINRHLVLYKVISEVKYEVLHSRTIFCWKSEKLKNKLNVNLIFTEADLARYCV